MINLFNFFLKMKSVEERIADIQIDHKELYCLPGIEINADSNFYTIPKKISCVYFLVHPTRGILYIGKALDLRNRWTNKYHIQRVAHDCHEPCLKLGMVSLRWFLLDDPVKTIAEMLLIRKIRPEWNSEFMGPRPAEIELDDENLDYFQKWMKEKPRTEKQAQKFMEKLLHTQGQYKKTGKNADFEPHELMKDMSHIKFDDHVEFDEEEII